jgi:hypothetical protein
MNVVPAIPTTVLAVVRKSRMLLCATLVGTAKQRHMEIEMKVLKQPDNTWNYKHICDTCDAELQVDKEDILHSHYSGDMREPSYDTYRAQCPVCRQWFDIPESKITKIVKLEIQKGRK